MGVPRGEEGGCEVTECGAITGFCVGQADEEK